MARKHILHMLTPLQQMSPFDVNMALDAGFDAVVPYVGVSLGDVTGLVQDAIFSRPPKAATGIFIGGKDITLALEMMNVARRAMVPDPVGCPSAPVSSMSSLASHFASARRS